ncbi:MAG: hypothetical protein E7340_05670 [Clostridiales bacterium]|nr:hypothetical protein [Clostridiales bacterium]MBE5754798.1 hypothetical protein [Clostridiales bacterium]
MKKILIKIITLMLCAVLCLSTLIGCAGGPKVKLPDYTGEEFKFFAYTSPTSGEWVKDGEIYYTEDYQTVERYKEYKESGLNILMLTGDSGFTNEGPWKESTAYKCMTNAYAAGIDKIILDDIRLTTLVYSQSLVGGEGAIYSPEDADGDGVSDALYRDVKSYLETYYKQPGFYGIRLGDEPDCKYQESFGHVYRAVTAASKKLGMEDIYIFLNLFPHFAPGENTFSEEPTSTFEQAYMSYLEGFLETTRAPRLCVDIYFFKGYGMTRGNYACLQLFERACKNYGARTTFALQSYEGWSGNTVNYDLMDRAMMNFEMNSCIGMGMTEFAYYTYMPGKSYSTTGTKALERGSFLTRNGEKTNIYYYAQETMAIAQKLAPIITNYKFQGSKLYTCDDPWTQDNPIVANFDYTNYFRSSVDEKTNTAIEFDNSYKFKKINKVNIDNDIAFVTELYDQTNDLYMYMAQNVIDPRSGALGRTDMNVSIDFGDYEWVAQIEDGDVTYVKLEDGIYNKALSAGYAVYLVPLV